MGPSLAFVLGIVTTFAVEFIVLLFLAWPDFRRRMRDRHQ